MTTSCGLLVSFETLRLGLRNGLVELRLTRLVNAPRSGIKTTGVVAKSLVLLVLGTTGALETNARLAGTLASVVSAFLGRNVLGVGASASLSSATNTDRSAGELVETRLVDARLFRGDGGLGVERVLEPAVRLVVKITELYGEEEAVQSQNRAFFELDEKRADSETMNVPARR